MMELGEWLYQAGYPQQDAEDQIQVRHLGSPSPPGLTRAPAQSALDILMDCDAAVVAAEAAAAAATHRPQSTRSSRSSRTSARSRASSRASQRTAGGRPVRGLPAPLRSRLAVLTAARGRGRRRRRPSLGRRTCCWRCGALCC
jgi:hypothetical protein